MSSYNLLMPQHVPSTPQADSGPSMPQEVEDFLSAVCEVEGIKGLIRRQDAANFLVGCLRDVGIPRLAAKLLYRWVIIPVVEKGCDAATAWSGRNLKKWAKAVVVYTLSRSAVREHLPGVCDKIRDWQTSASAPVADGEVDPADTDDLEEMRLWLADNMESMQKEYAAAVEALHDEVSSMLDRQSEAKLTAMPWGCEEPSGDQLLIAKSRGVPFVGREEELGALKQFLDTDDYFSWWAVSAPGGSGKTRLLFEFIEKHAGLWTAGFVPSSCGKEDWQQWRPTGCTLIVVDYAYAQQEFIAWLLQRVLDKSEWGESQTGAKVRVLILDRHVPDVRGFSKDPVWSRFIDGPGDRAQFTSHFHGDSPLRLDPPEDSSLRSIVENVSELNGEPVTRMMDWLNRSDDLRRPLFAVLCGLCLRDGGEALKPGGGRVRLIEHYLRSRHRLPWREGTAAGRGAGILVAQATALDGIPADDDSLPQPLRNEYEQSEELAREITASSHSDRLEKLEPDLLGETFFWLLFSPDERNSLAQKSEERRWVVKSLWDDEEQGKCVEFVVRALSAFGDEYSHSLDEDELDRLWAGAMRFMREIPATDKGCLQRQTALCLAVANLEAKEAVPREKVLDLVRFFEHDVFLSDWAKSRGNADWLALGALGRALQHLREHPDCEESEIAQVWEQYKNLLLDRSDLGAIACAAFGLEEVLRWLLDQGASFSVRGQNEWTPLHVAAGVGHEGVVKVLLEAGADKEAGDQQGETPLHVAAGVGHEGVVEVLLEAEADKEATQQQGLTPLHVAAGVGHEGVVKVLLKAGADKEARDQQGVTPLHVAAFKGHEGVVKVLLAYGAKVGVADDDGDTPLSLAKERGNQEVAKLLLASETIEK